MLQQLIKKVIIFCLGLVIMFSIEGSTFAYDNPDLLPKEQTPIIDLAKTLSEKQRLDLETSLNSYEEETGWKIRVLSQYEKTPGLAVKDYWGLDETSLLIIADPRGGNLLSFNVGDAYFALMPRIFWVELQTRFGNQFYVKDNGEDGAILASIKAVETCLDRGGCEVVPGLPQEQWQWTLLTSLLGGIIAGFAASPRKNNESFSIGWLLLLSPLWIMLFGIFGIAPVVTRTNDVLPLTRNILGFIGSAIGAYLIAERKFKDPDPDLNKQN
tara:strand:+ start:2649 stop:3458 length:810 start_codon:yes stop_codon:yes gene_type:complete